MAVTSSPIHKQGEPSRIVASWTRGLGRTFSRVALFWIERTKASVVAVHGMRPRPRTSISLLQQTPLRWAVEAASPIISAGVAPGGPAIAAALGISQPRAFAVVPLVFGGKLAALAYVDQASSPLPIAAAGELFAYVGRILREQESRSPSLAEASLRSPARRPGARRVHRPQLELVHTQPEPPPSEPFCAPLAEYTAAEQAEAAEAPAVGADLAESIAARIAAETAHELTTGTEEQSEPEPLVAEAEAGGPDVRHARQQPIDAEDLRPITARGEQQRTGEATAGAEPRQVQRVMGPAIVTPDGVIAATKQRAPRRWLSYLAAALVLVAGSTGLLVAPLAPVDGVPAGDRVVQIPRNASVARIAEHLQGERVVKSSFAFTWLARLTGVDRDLRAGVYRLPTGVWAWSVLAELQTGQVNTRTVTIPEGLTLSEVAAELQAAGLARATDILREAREPHLRQKYGIPAETLEGFLFPETYTMAQGLTAREILTVMLEEFYARLAGVPQAAAIESPEELLAKVTLASIVEREARDKSELRRVSGVFHNRMVRNMRLESCATVQYVLGSPKQRLSVADVRTASPYNTYLHPGLPPGPISSPGLAALRAAFAPETHDLLFFFARQDGSGKHVFSKTYEAHQQKQRALRRR